MSQPQAQRAATRKQRCPAGILHHLQLMNDSTLAVTTLRDVLWRLMFYAGAVSRPRSSIAGEKRKREGCAMWSAFLDAGWSRQREQVEYRSRADEAGVKAEVAGTALLIWKRSLWP